MNNKILNLINTNPKVKYGLALLVLPIVLLVTVLQGGSLGDVFSQKINDRETRQIVQKEVNDKKSRYGFSVATATDVDCDEKLKNKYDSEIHCSINASRTLGGSIEGPITVTVRVRSIATDTSPIQVDIQDIQPTK